MPEIPDFLDAFSRALAGDDAALDRWTDGDGSRAGLAVHRNTIARARAEVLAAQFPTVERLVGGEWFHDAAMLFGVLGPPTSPVMTDYGAGFPDWLAGFGPAHDMPYLAPVARLDWAWSRALFAADDPLMGAEAVAGLSSQTLMTASVRLHASVAVFWFEWTAATIWLAHRSGTENVDDLAWMPRGEGLLISRPGPEVRVRRIDHAEWAFLDACRSGETLGQAAQAALAVDPRTGLERLFTRLIGEGVFSRLRAARLSS